VTFLRSAPTRALRANKTVVSPAKASADCVIVVARVLLDERGECHGTAEDDGGDGRGDHPGTFARTCKALVRTLTRAFVLAQLGHVGLHRAGRRGGATFTPQLLDQPVRAHRLAGMDHQAGQQPAPLSTAQVDYPTGARHLERAKDPKIHRHPLPRPLAGEAAPIVSAATRQTPH
jgi:hypothetical protein